MEFSARYVLSFIRNLGAEKFVPVPICGGQSGNGTRFCPSASVFCCQHRSTNLHTRFHLNTTLTTRTSGRSLRTFYLSKTLATVGKHWKGKYFHNVFFFSHQLKDKWARLGNLPTNVMLWRKSESIKKENYFHSVFKGLILFSLFLCLPSLYLCERRFTT